VLERFVDLGMSQNEVDAILGRPRSRFVHGPGFEIADYGEWREHDVVIEFYPDGEAYAIGYRKNARSVILRSDAPVTWPKTKNGNYERLRQKND
jgi:hypothetical protein